MAGPRGGTIYEEPRQPSATERGRGVDAVAWLHKGSPSAGWARGRGASNHANSLASRYFLGRGECQEREPASVSTGHAQTPACHCFIADSESSSSNEKKVEVPVSALWFPPVPPPLQCWRRAGHRAEHSTNSRHATLKRGGRGGWGAGGEVNPLAGQRNEYPHPTNVGISSDVLVDITDCVRLILNLNFNLDLTHNLNPGMYLTIKI